ncbi:MAG: UbiD family decarboxylase [Proteobacteria bacterium]|nr:UbiD family decarboxylase [Pseudomonadota bacterium]
MGYASLAACVRDLQSHGHLRRVDVELDPFLELAALQRSAYRAGGPALLFTNVKGCRFPLVCNLFGTLERARFMFRDSLRAVERLIELRVDPTRLVRQPWRYLGVPLTALRMLPRRTARAPVLKHTMRVSELPHVQSWPRDGGAFITLPQVYSEHPERPGLHASNLGMYRIQLSGGHYQGDREVGLHYQIHRGIGVHHEAALRRGQTLPVNVFVGGPPAMTLAAVMPLPEGMSELGFAGALSRRRVRMAPVADGLPVHADADFCLVGHVEPGRTLPEGPFGDHLGYYSLAHDFPVLTVQRVHHRDDPIWPFTTVGRPPQEDTVFGKLVHELSEPMIPALIPGVHAVHAVDAAGVHPLLLALGSERYSPYAELAQPQELLTQANAILGQGQMSLAKYVVIAARDDALPSGLHDIGAFLDHVLSRFRAERDLHFHTETTIDTLDYSGAGLHRGSKLVIAAVGKAIRKLPAALPSGLRLPEGFSEPRVVIPGVLSVRAPRASQPGGHELEPGLNRFCTSYRASDAINAFPWIVLVDDSDFTARNLDNFLWVTFTRSDPARDIWGIEATIRHKHWGCRGALVIDARVKEHHAPALEEDAAVTQKLEGLAVKGGPLEGLMG